MLVLALCMYLLTPLAPCTQVDEKAVGRLPEPARLWAAVIGINGYADKPLRFCASDAELLSKSLQEQCGYRPERIYRLIDTERGFQSQPTRENILKTTKLIAGLTKEQDTLLFYFSGHGVVIDGTAYLVPVDASGPASGDLISIAAIRKVLAEAKAQRCLMILDACHSGSTKGNDQPAMTPAFERALRSEAEGIVTLASCRAEEVSLEIGELKHGLFTYWLVQGLTGNADTEAGGNRDGFVDAGELYDYLSERVPSDAAQRHRRRQNPVMHASVSGKFTLAELSKSEAETSTPQPTPGNTSQDSQVIRRGSLIEVSVLVEGKDDLERIQNARYKSRRLYAEYIRAHVSRNQDLDSLLQFAASKENLDFDAEMVGEKLRYVVRIPIP